MAHAISIKCTNRSAEPVLSLWDEASQFEDAPSMRGLSYPPHLTLAVFSDDLRGIHAIFDEVFASQSKLSVTFDSVGHFENDFVVLWLRPRPCSALLDLHARLHQHFDPLVCRAHYRVGQWIPHCSLATRVPKAKAANAIEWTLVDRPEITVDFDAADLVEFLPVSVEREQRLF